MSDKQGVRPVSARTAGVVGALFAVAMLVLAAGLGSAATSHGQGGPVAPVAVVSSTPPVSTVTATATATVRATVEPCQEDEPCFNPCTMGVNGLYPEWDPRYYVPGPCDLSTKLPHGRFLVAEVSGPGAVRTPVGAVCDTVHGGYWARVSVFVRNADGSDVAGSLVERQSCVPAAPYSLDGQVSGLLPEMFREAARAA